MKDIMIPKYPHESLRVVLASGNQVRVVSAEGVERHVTIESVTSVKAAILWVVIGLIVGILLRSAV